MRLIAQWRRQRKESVKGTTEITQFEQQKENRLGGFGKPLKKKRASGIWRTVTKEDRDEKSLKEICENVTNQAKDRNLQIEDAEQTLGKDKLKEP